MTFEEMYLDYRRSTDGVEFIKSDDGFVSYQVVEDRQYLLNIYLAPDKRKTPIDETNPVVKLARQAEVEGIERGCKYIMSNLEHSNPAKNTVLKYLLFLGFKLSHNEGENIIVLYKELYV